MIVRKFLFVCVVLFMFTAQAYAQNVGGVFGPVVDEGHRSFQYRAAVNPDNAQDNVGFVQRLHYQQSINDDFRWRVLGQTQRVDEEGLDFDLAAVELLWELSNNEDRNKHAVRFDGRVLSGNRAEQLGFNWISDWNFADGWMVRTLLFTTLQLGNNSASGVNIQTRTRLAKKLKSGPVIGVENFSNYGNTGNFNNFSDQSHTIGPFGSISLGNGVSLFGGPLIGITDGSPDFEARLWVTRGF